LKKQIDLKKPEKLEKIGKITLITTLLVIGTAASAQSSRFTGLSLEAATGYQEMTIKIEDVKINNRHSGRADQDMGLSGVPVALNIGYSVALTGTLGLGARFEYNPKSGRIALSTLPSVALTQNLQAYGKLGWAYMASAVDSEVLGSMLNGQTAYFNGPLVGIGAKLLLTDNVYVFAELTYYKYADLTLAAQKGSHNLSGKASSSAQNVLIGLGYKF
jgi:opacity protein-like surface antigen